MADEDPPEGLTPELFQKLVSDGTLDGMKRYDAEREQWEAAVKEQDRVRQEAEKDNPPGGKGRDFGAFLLGGKRT
jgi:hypothetical protein